MSRAIGSFPRLRGTGDGFVPLRLERRFIPACAGNGRCRASGRSAPSVHPRVCGERRKEAAELAGTVGSSPRVRGTVPVAEGRHAT